MRFFKTCVAAAALMLMVACLAACGKRGAGEEADTSGKSAIVDTETSEGIKEDDGVYAATIKKLELKGADGVEMQFSYYKDGTIYGIVQKLNASIQWYETYLRAIDEKTGEIIGEDIKITDENGDSIWPSYISPVGDDELAVLSNRYVDNRNENVLYIMGRDGTVKARKSIAEVPGVREDAYVSDIASDGTYVYLLYDGKLLAFDRELHYKKTVLESNSASMCVGNDGMLYILEYLANGRLSSFDAAKDKLNEGIAAIPGCEYMYAGKGNELLIGSASSMRSYNTETQAPTKLFDFTDLGFSPQMPNCVYRDEAGDIHILYSEFKEKMEEGDDGGLYNEQVFVHMCAIVKRYDKSEVQETQEIRVACMYYNSDIRNVIREYNLAHSDIKIKIKAYMDEYSDSKEREAAMDRDVIEKTDYDIFILQPYNFDRYADKGLFEDLMPYIENDASFDISRYYENALFALKEGDKLYGLVTEMMLSGYGGDVTVFGDKERLTMDDIMEARKKYPDIPFIDGATDMTVVARFMSSYDCSTYIGDKGSYNFDTEEFRKLCEFAGTFPRDDGDVTYISPKDLIDSDEVKLTLPTYYAAENILTERARYGKNYRSYGVASKEGNGYYIVPVTAYYISAFSNHKEEAWEIIKSFMDAKPEYWGGQYRVSREVSRKELDNLYERTNQILSGGVTFGGTTYTLSMTEDEIDVFEQMVEDATARRPMDSPVYTIMAEELPAYFAGEKSLDDIIKIIQKRVDIYLEEKK